MAPPSKHARWIRPNASSRDAPAAREMGSGGVYPHKAFTNLRVPNNRCDW